MQHNLILSTINMFIDQHPMSIFDSLVIQPQKEEYRHCDKAIEMTYITRDQPSINFLCWFNQQQTTLPIEQLRHLDEAIFNDAIGKVSKLDITDNNQLSSDDLKRLQVLYDICNDLLTRFLTYSYQREQYQATLLDSYEPFLDLAGIVEQNNSLSTLASYYGALTHCYLSRRDHFHLGQQRKEHVNEKELRAGNRELSTLLISRFQQYIVVISPAVKRVMTI